MNDSWGALAALGALSGALGRLWRCSLDALGRSGSVLGSSGNALGQHSFGDECNVGRKYVRAVRSKIDP